MPGTYPSIESPVTTLVNELKFDHDSDAFYESGSHSFTLAARRNCNLVGKIIRLNTPVAVDFSADFIEHPDSAALDITKLNLYIMVYHENWNGTGTKKVVYRNALFDAV